MSQEYIKQLEDEIAALKKNLEEKAIEESTPTDIRNLRHLYQVSEDMPLVINDSDNKEICKLVKADRNKRNRDVILKMKIRKGWIRKGWVYKEVIGWFDDWCAYPVTNGNQHSDKLNGLLKETHIEYADAFFRMLEAAGVITREDKNVGMQS